MKRLTAHVLAQTELRGANHGLVTTSEGIVMIGQPRAGNQVKVDIYP